MMTFSPPRHLQESHKRQLHLRPSSARLDLKAAVTSISRKIQKRSPGIAAINVLNFVKLAGSSGKFMRSLGAFHTEASVKRKQTELLSVKGLVLNHGSSDYMGSLSGLLPLVSAFKPPAKTH